MALFPVLSGRANFDSSDNAATDTFSAGIRYTQAGAVRTTPDAGTVFNQGIPMSPSGQVAVLDATAGLPADVTWLSGMPISGNKVCVSTNAVSAVSSGTPYDAAGAVAGSGYFIPRMLFLSGAEGVWYDPSDSATLFSDTAGTTPCAAPGAGALVNVGLMLDKSKGLVLGSELVTTYNNTGAYGNWNQITLIGSTLSASQPTSNGYSARVPVVAGRRYLVSLPATLVPSGGSWDIRVSWSVNGSAYSGQVVVVPINTTQFSFVAPATAVSCEVSITRIVASSLGATDTCGPFTSISVKELPGNHAISYNATTARPELSARVNLLTFSEQFDNAAWTRNTNGLTVNATTAPNGTLTAAKLLATVPNEQKWVYRAAISVSNATTYKFSCYFKAAEYQYAQLRIFTTAKIADIGFTLSGSGSIFSTNTGSGSIESVGNGWYLCSVVGTSSATSAEVYINMSDTATLSKSFAGDGTSGIFIWGADLRPTNIGANVPAYQRIADQYTYDTVGFPRYLRFDGVDDGMSTPANLNLSATDKATVFAGVRKLSDAATFSVVSELSTNLNTNAGAFALYAPGSSGTYAIGATGATLQSWGLMSTYTAPITNVLSNSLNLSGANRATQIVPRVNGALVSLTGGLDSANIGGNFGNYPLYIGSRANSSLFLNANLYSLIVVGAASTAAQISSTESWINGKEGGVY